MLKAPSIEGAFSFQRHRYRGSHPGWGTGDSGRCLPSPLVSPIPGRWGSSLATPNLAWNFGRWLLGFPASTTP